MGCGVKLIPSDCKVDIGFVSWLMDVGGCEAPSSPAGPDEVTSPLGLAVDDSPLPLLEFVGGFVELK